MRHHRHSAPVEENQLRRFDPPRFRQPFEASFADRFGFLFGCATYQVDGSNPIVKAWRDTGALTEK